MTNTITMTSLFLVHPHNGSSPHLVNWSLDEKATCFGKKQKAVINFNFHALSVVSQPPKG